MAPAVPAAMPAGRTGLDRHFHFHVDEPRRRFGLSRPTVTLTTRRSCRARGSRLVNWFLATIEPIEVTLPVSDWSSTWTVAESPVWSRGMSL